MIKHTRLPLYLLRILLIGLLLTVLLYIINPGIMKQASRFLRIGLWEPHSPWTLKIQQDFLKCGHGISLQKKYSTKAAIDDFLKRHEDCSLLSNSARIVNCLEKVADFCPTCRDKQFLGVRDQEVVVIRGTPGRPGPVKERTLIKAKLLPDAEVADLRTGISFRDDREKLQLLEGLSGLVSN